MSPRWRDEVELRLAPRQLTLRRRAWRAGRAVDALEVAVPGGEIAEPGPALAQLALVLHDAAWQRARARVVVSDAWVRYAVVPPARLAADERLTHARYVLRDLFGDAVAGWSVTLSDAPPGRACVACAMPPEVRTGLEDALGPARLALGSLQPRLVAAHETWRHRLPGDDAWLVCADEGWLSAVHVRAREWERVHGARLSSDWTLELDRLQAFARLTRTGASGGRVFVDAPARMRREARPDEDLIWLAAPGEDDGGPTRAVALQGG